MWIAALSSLVLLSAALAAYGRWIEPYWVKRRSRSIRDIRSNLPIRLAHLSDLHCSDGDQRRLQSIRKAVAITVDSKPDLICLTGDFTTSGAPFDGPALASVLRPLSAVAPCLAVLGNHDGGGWASRRRGRSLTTEPVTAMLEQAGIQLLHNRSTQVNVRGRELFVAGLGDVWAEQMDPLAAFASLPQDRETLLLSHNPDTKDHLTRFAWKWMLSGHTHGGEVTLFGWAPFLPVHDRRCRLGLVPFGDRWIHITAGLGSISGFRFCCRPEVSILEI